MRDYDPTTWRYIQAYPLGLVDGASVYGYALQNPGRYVDPTGEFIPVAVVIGLSVGTWIAGEILEDQYEKCGCGESDVGDQAAAVGLGGMVFGKTIDYPRKPIPGTTPSGGTSIWSSKIGTKSKPARDFGRKAAGKLPYVGAAVLGYNAYKLAECLHDKEK